MNIVLHHPGIGGIVQAVDINGDGGETQAKHYETLGWVRVPDDVIGQVVAEVGGTSPEAILANVKAHLTAEPESLHDALLKLTRDELVERAEAAAVEVPAKATKADIIELLTKEP